MGQSRDRSLLAEVYLAPWSSPRRGAPGEDRIFMRVMSAMLWLMSFALFALVAVVAFHIANYGEQPSLRMEGVVASRAWHAASSSVTTATTVTPNGQVVTTLVPTSDPEKYEVCLQLEEQRSRAAVRPSCFEVLRPGVRAAALIQPPARTMQADADMALLDALLDALHDHLA